MAATWQAVYDKARSQVGYNGTGSEDRPLSKFGAWYGLNPAQWCAMFVSWCFAAAGGPLKIETAKGFASCRGGAAFFQREGRWHGKEETPAPGDLVFFDFDGIGVAHHVGIVVSATSRSNILSIQGNTTDTSIGRTGNCCRKKSHTNKYVLGYGRPRYGSSFVTVGRIGIEMQILRADNHGPLVLVVGNHRTNISNAQRVALMRQDVPEIDLTADPGLYDTVVHKLDS